MLLKFNDTTVEYINGLSAAADRYDAFLLDIWGVLHDSVRPYPGAVDCLRQLKKNGKSVLLVSNAARRSAILENELAALGIPRELYNQIVSSGELTWQAFASGRDQLLQQIGKRYYLLGTEKYGLTQNLPLLAAETLESADFLLNIGIIGSHTSTEAAEPLLQEAAALNLPMVCANPDLKVVRDGILGIAPGAVAARYEKLGGRVIYFGKPHSAIYQQCFDILRERDKKRIVAVGDALKTDIAGANDNGIDSIMIAGGIHGGDLAELPMNTDGLAAICGAEKQTPTMIADQFSW